MTSLDKIERASTATPASAVVPGRHLAIELAETLKLGVPIALTQLGQIAMMTTDLAMIGRLGAEAVAAASLAHTVLFVSFTAGMGLVSAVAPLAAQAFGARDPHLIRRSLRVGLWAALLMSLPLMALRFWAEQILLALGQAPATAHHAQEYLAGLVWTILPALWFMAIRGFMSAINRPEPVLWITLAAIPANALLVYLLLFGAFGLPPLGLFGAGLGTSIVNLGMFLAVVWFATYRRPFRKYHVFGHFWRIDWRLMWRLIVIGAPISISFLLEYGLFGAAGLLMGLISTTALAAHQIALQVAAILFMVPFGISMAATVRVGHADRARRRRRGPARGLCRNLAWHRAHRHPDARRDRRPLRHRGALPGRKHRRDRRTFRDAIVGRIDLLHRRRHPDRRRRLAARHERHANTAVVRDPQLLADRLRAAPAGSPSGRRQAPSACGSDCRSEPRFMPRFWCCASAALAGRLTFP